MRISDWSSDVCSSDLVFGHERDRLRRVGGRNGRIPVEIEGRGDFGRAVFGARRRRHQRRFGGRRRLARHHAIGEIAAAQAFGVLAGRFQETERDAARAEESGGGKEWDSTCRSGWARYHKKNKRRQP